MRYQESSQRWQRRRRSRSCKAIERNGAVLRCGSGCTWLPLCVTMASKVQSVIPEAVPWVLATVAAALKRMTGCQLGVGTKQAAIYARHGPVSKPAVAGSI